MQTTAPRPNMNPRTLPVLALAGRAVLTFRNIEKGTHFTVKIRQARDRNDRKIKLDHYNVTISLLGDKTQGMRYAGMMFPKENFRIWVARGVRHDDQLAIVFRWLINAIRNPESLRGRVHIFHENKCCQCGQPLTHPESVYTGIGPVCMKRLEAHYANSDINMKEIFAPVNNAG